MAPESYFSKAGDVWSLGVLLHEMLTGDLPSFDRTTNTIILNKRGVIQDAQVLSLLKKIFVREPLKRIKIDDLICEITSLQETELHISQENEPDFRASTN
jgi:serine/threonine protein kinase